MTQPAQKPGRSKQDYQTPANFIRAVKARLRIDEFAFDFAADASNHQAELYFDEQCDALAEPDWDTHCREQLDYQDWGWLNPPFTRIEPWAKRCWETKQAGGSIAFLVPAGVGANWFRDYVDGKALVLLLNGRLAFMPDKPKWLYPKDCLLALYSPYIDPGYQVWSWREAQSKRAEKDVA